MLAYRLTHTIVALRDGDHELLVVLGSAGRQSITCLHHKLQHFAMMLRVDVSQIPNSSHDIVKVLLQMHMLNIGFGSQCSVGSMHLHLEEPDELQRKIPKMSEESVIYRTD